MLGAKGNCRDPSPAGKHGGLRMTDDPNSKFGLNGRHSRIDRGGDSLVTDGIASVSLGSLVKSQDVLERHLRLDIVSR